MLGLLQQLGCEVIDLGMVRDDPLLLEAALRQAAASADASCCANDASSSTTSMLFAAIHASCVTVEL